MSIGYYKHHFDESEEKVMEEPVRIWTRAHEVFDEDPGFPPSFGPVQQYLRADLFEKGKRWMVHAVGCNVYKGKSTYDGVICHPAECDCGLSKYLEEVGKCSV